jgi:hypothetical protein
MAHCVEDSPPQLDRSAAEYVTPVCGLLNHGTYHVIVGGSAEAAQLFVPLRIAVRIRLDQPVDGFGRGQRNVAAVRSSPYVLWVKSWVVVLRA